MSKRFWCWILVFSLAFQPLIFEGACWAEETSGSTGTSTENTADGQVQNMTKADQEFEEVYKKVMETQEIKNPSKGGIGGFIKGLALKVTGKKKEVDEAIAKANEELKKMKEDMTKMREEIKAGKEKATDAATKSKEAVLQKQLETAGKIKSEVSVAMKTVGQKVIDISGMLKKVAGTMAGIAAVIAPIPIVGAISGVLFGVATVLGKVSAVIGVAGKALITFADKADLSAQDFMKTLGEAKEAWKKGGEEFKRPPKDKDGKDGKGEKEGKDGKGGKGKAPDKTVVLDKDGNPVKKPEDKIEVKKPDVQLDPKEKDDNDKGKGKGKDEGVKKPLLPGGEKDDDDDFTDGTCEVPGSPDPLPSKKLPPGTSKAYFDLSPKENLMVAEKQIENMNKSGFREGIMTITTQKKDEEGKTPPYTFSLSRSEAFPHEVSIGGQKVYVGSTVEKGNLELQVRGKFTVDIQYK